MPNSLLSAVLRGTAFLLLLVAFFLSGASALVYQVVWTRQLALVFGVTLYAISAVLATFMGGLAIGSYLAGRTADRVRRPLLWYVGMEAAIAVCGAVSVVAIGGLTPAYVWLYGVTGGAGFAVTLIRFLAACLVLLLPAALMGATLPFIVRASLVLLPHFGKNLSLLYALNTAGAATGTLVAGFYLIERLGLQGAVLTAAAGNVTVAFIGLLLEPVLSSIGKSAAASGDAEAQPASAGQPGPSPAAKRAVLLAMGVSGFCALAYEVLWFRVLDLFLNGTIYAFSLMLFTFLLGLALGSVAVRLVIGRGWNWVAVLGALQAVIALVTLGSFFTVVQVPGALRTLAASPALADWLREPVFAMTLVSLLVLLPLTLLLGFIFPMAAQALAQGRTDTGNQIGRMTAVNTGGAILGSLAAGFWLIPVLGSQTSLTSLAVINGALALLLLWLGLERRPRWRLAAALPVAAFVLLLVNVPDLTPEVLRRIYPANKVLWLEEGLENTVSVQASPDGVKTMYMNSRGQTSDAPDMSRYHSLIGALPMVLHPQPREALVIGLGGGATAGAASRFRSAQVDVIELSPSVVRAADEFRHINHDVARQSNVRMIVDDGRNYLLLTPKRYDVITADLIYMQHAGAGNIYSREYFETAKRALKEDGIMLQWASHWTEGVYYPHIVRTFMTVFPYVTFWHEGSLMAGSMKPFDVSAEALARRYRQPEVAAALEDGIIPTLDTLLKEYYGDAAKMRAFAGDGPLVTDDHPITEFYRALPGADSHAAGVIPKGR